MGGGISVAMEEVLRMSEKDFSAGHKADVQLALIFASGFDDQDESLRTALSLLRRKYTFVKHVIATVVSFTACIGSQFHAWAPCHESYGRKRYLIHVGVYGMHTHLAALLSSTS